MGQFKRLCDYGEYRALRRTHKPTHSRPTDCPKILYLPFGFDMTPDKPGARGLYKALRQAFPDFHAVIHWQTADGEIVTTFKTYHGTHKGTFLGVPPTGRSISFETVDAMRVHLGKITEHWGVANL